MEKEKEVERGIAAGAIAPSPCLMPNSSILSFITAYFYYLLRTSRQSTLCKYYFSFLIPHSPFLIHHSSFIALLPSTFSITLLHAFGLLTSSSLNRPAFILLRSLYLSFSSSSPSSSKREEEEIQDDLISATATAIGLLGLREGAVDLDVSCSSIPILVMSFLPCCPIQLGRSEGLPEVSE